MTETESTNLTDTVIDADNMANPSITFYDIASGPPMRPFAPNPWKTRSVLITPQPAPSGLLNCTTRYALNFKRIHAGIQYKTNWTELTQVTQVRKSLGAAPVRKHWVDDSDFYTLPVIVDHAASNTVGDSLDIALYLERTYPNTDASAGGPLFPGGTEGLHRAFNVHVDTIFSQHVILACHGIPFNPQTAAESHAEFCRRTGKEKWEDLNPQGEEREKLLKSFEAALGEFLKVYTRREEGPFLEGKSLMYADFIVGGWLRMLSVTLPEWESVRSWHNGHWGRLHDALAEYAQKD